MNSEPVAVARIGEEGPESVLAACAAGAEWVWLLGPGADPEPDALQRLLDAREPVGSGPAAIVCGVARGPAGTVDEGTLPGVRIGDPDLFALAAERLLPIRNAPFVNCLVETDCFRRHGFPDHRRYGTYAGVAWSALVLQDQRGYCTPLSAVSLPVAAARRSLRSACWPARLVRDGAWTRGDVAAAFSRRVRPEDGLR